MQKPTLFSFQYFPSFQNKDAFFQKLILEENVIGKILNLSFLLFLFSFFYGIVMGSYHSLLQAITAGIKLPLLFFLSLLICFPAFFIIQYILGSKLRLSQMIVIILAGMVLTAAIMISFAPVVVFFLLTGSNYYFLQLLHISIFILAGIFGMKTVIDALKFACEKKAIYPRVGVEVFRFWAFILAFVGIQLAWNLRPFLGDTGKQFKLFRKYEGNFYTALIWSFQQLAKPDQKTNGNEPSQTVKKHYPDTLLFPSDLP
jgi:hypothetical protein